MSQENSSFIWRLINILLQIDDGHKSTDLVMRDFCDGKKFSQHPLLKKDPSFLQIALYYDDLEVCNPIGSRRIIHKLGNTLYLIMFDNSMCYFHCTAVFYFFLCNIDPMLRSKVRRIQLVAIAKSEHFKRYGANLILQPMIEDIKKLVSA